MDTHALPEGLKLHPTHERYVHRLVITDAQDEVWVTFPTIREFTEREDSLDWIATVIGKTCGALGVQDVFDDEGDHLTENGNRAILDGFVLNYYADEA